MGRFAESTYQLLPDYIRAADEHLPPAAGGPWLLRRWLGSLCDTADAAVTGLDAFDPITNKGVSAAQDPANLPSQLLPWLMMLTGMWPDYLGTDPEALRRLISQPVDARRRGTVEAIRAAVALTLTGSRRVKVTIDPADPWHIIVDVIATEVPDLKATEAAALREKPAGAWLTVNTGLNAQHNHTVGSMAGRVRDTHGHTVGELAGRKSGHTHTVGSLAGRP